MDNLKLRVLEKMLIILIVSAIVPVILIVSAIETLRESWRRY
jgi:hypothetical protein